MRKTFFRLGWVFLAVWFFVAACFAGRIYHENLPRGVVLADKITARFGPTENDVVAFDLHEGSSFRILSRQSGWLQIKLADGKIAWVQQKGIGEI